MTARSDSRARRVRKRKRALKRRTTGERRWFRDYKRGGYQWELYDPNHADGCFDLNRHVNTVREESAVRARARRDNGHG